MSTCDKSGGPFFRGATGCEDYNIFLCLCIVHAVCCQTVSTFCLGPKKHPLSSGSKFWSTPRWPWKIISNWNAFSKAQRIIKIDPKSTKTKHYHQLRANQLPLSVLCSFRDKDLLPVNLRGRTPCRMAKVGQRLKHGTCP